MDYVSGPSMIIKLKVFHSPSYQNLIKITNLKKLGLQKAFIIIPTLSVCWVQKLALTIKAEFFKRTFFFTIIERTKTFSTYREEITLVLDLPLLPSTWKKFTLVACLLVSEINILTSFNNKFLRFIQKWYIFNLIPCVHYGHTGNFPSFYFSIPMMVLKEPYWCCRLTPVFLLNELYEGRWWWWW